MRVSARSERHGHQYLGRQIAHSVVARLVAHAQAQIMRRGRTGEGIRSAGAGPDLSLADQAAEHAAFKFEQAGILHCDVARIGPAILGIVDLSRPLVGSVRLHAEDEHHLRRF